jgi:SOS-response transcriptional repressor LexA
MMRDCTPKQLKILKFIKSYQDINELSPTFAEIAGEMKVSAVTIFEHINALEKKGLIKRNKHKARSVEIVDNIVEPKLDVINGVFYSGRPIGWFVEPIKYDFGFSGSDFALRVNDDYLNHFGVLKNDLLVFSSREAIKGDIVLLSDGEYGNAMVVKYGDRNPGIPIGNIKVRGVLARLIREIAHGSFCLSNSKGHLLGESRS